MYPIYKTEGIVISVNNTGESNQVVSVYTRDFGMLHGLLTSSRKLEAKLSGHFQLFNYIELECVYGVRGWRFTYANTVSYVFTKDHSSFSRIALLVKRFFHDEEKDIKFFTTLKEYFYLLKDTQEDRKYLECVIVYRMLYILGYMNPKEELEGLIVHSWPEAISIAKEFYKKCLHSINTSLRGIQT